MDLLEYCRARERELAEFGDSYLHGLIPARMLENLTRSRSLYERPYWDTTNVLPNAADDRMRGLCRDYGAASPEVQQAARCSVTAAVGLDLLVFSLRSGIFALRERSTTALHEGLLALALENLARDEPRENISLLHKLYWVAMEIGVEPGLVLRSMIACSGPATVSIIDDYFLDREPQRIGDGFSFRLFRTPQGMSFGFP